MRILDPVTITDPVTALPVVINPQLIRRFASKRVRATILPVHPYGELQPDDLLPVCEAVTIERGQPRRNRLTIRYDGSHLKVGVPWPSMLKKLEPGRRTAHAMPLCASRYTLRVRSAVQTSLRNISDEDAIACGVEPSFGGGFCSPLGDPEWFKPCNTGAEALAHVWDDMQSGARGMRALSLTQMVVLVHFDAFARNISQIIPDFGTGAASWT